MSPWSQLCSVLTSELEFIRHLCEEVYVVTHLFSCSLTKLDISQYELFSQRPLLQWEPSRKGVKTPSQK